MTKLDEVRKLIDDLIIYCKADVPDFGDEIDVAEYEIVISTLEALRVGVNEICRDAPSRNPLAN